MQEYQISEIPGKNGYFVDTDGNVYSQWVNRGKHGVVKDSKLRELKASKGKNGYSTIRFGRKGDIEYLHRLVYRVFNGEIPEGKYVCHKDGNPQNNSLLNLYAGTQSENMRDAVKHGTSNLTKLTEKDVKEILSLRGQMMVKDIAYIYGVRRQTITDIFQGRTWQHLTRKVVKK